MSRSRDEQGKEDTYIDSRFLEAVCRSLCEYEVTKGPSAVYDDIDSKDSLGEAVIGKKSLTDDPVLVFYELKRRTFSSDKWGTTILPQNYVLEGEETEDL